MAPDAHWSYYVTAYAMRDWTEGVPRHGIRWPFLRRSLPKDLESEEDLGRTYLPLAHHDGLTIRIAPNNYRLLWERGTADWWLHDARVRARGVKGLAETTKARTERFVERLVGKPKWAEGMGAEEVESTKADFGKEFGAAAAATMEA